MAAKPLPPQEVLRQFLRYEPESGKLYWRESVHLELFKSLKGFRIWHTKYAGREAFTARHRHGYKIGAIRQELYLAHRVVATLLWGDIGDASIDHLNGVRSDNREANLRLASQTENMRNAAIGSHNSSGQVGVVWHKNLSKWGARIKIDGRNFHLGVFKNKEDAVAARKTAEAKFGFHPSHGRLPVHQP